MIIYPLHEVVLDWKYFAQPRFNCQHAPFISRLTTMRTFPVRHSELSIALLNLTSVTRAVAIAGLMFSAGIINLGDYHLLGRNTLPVCYREISLRLCR